MLTLSTIPQVDCCSPVVRPEDHLVAPVLLPASTGRGVRETPFPTNMLLSSTVSWAVRSERDNAPDMQDATGAGLSAHPPGCWPPI